MRLELLRKFILRLGIVALCCCAGLAAAARADEPDVRAILSAADARCREIKLISYEARSFGIGKYEKQVRQVEGTVTLEETTPGELPRIRAELNSRPAGGGEPSTLRLIADGRRVISIDDAKKTYVVASLPEADVIARAFSLSAYMQEFMHPRPFGDELEADSAVYVGQRTITGVPCDQIDVVYANKMGEARWFFEIESHLPRRVERVFRSGDDVGARVLELSGVRLGKDVEPVSFDVEPPAGYRQIALSDLSGVAATRSGLKPGTAAPDFELRTLDGTTLRLSSLRGKVVVLDFWATWARTCKLSIPRMETFRECYAPYDVQVIGVNIWEHEGSDAAAAMKKLGAQYTCVRGTEEVAKAYAIESLPTWYVIDREGTIVYAIDHFDPRADDEVADAVRKALKPAP